MKRRSFLSGSLYALASTRLGAQFGPAPFPPFEMVEAHLKDWQKRYPKLMTLNVAGQSVKGKPIYVVRMTDEAAPEETKQHALITALHAGQEHSGATAVLSVMQWLLSGDPLARKVLHNQVVVCMPVVNPDSYIDWLKTSGLANALGQDPYSAWTLDGPRDPARCPEAVAVQHVMDEFQADVHTDLHGNSLPFPGAYQIESSGRAYSNISVRPYHREVVRLMHEAALVEGYPSDELEEDAERIFGGSELGLGTEKVWGGVRTGTVGKSSSGSQRVYAAIYEYNRYHTMILANESSWERSALLRQRRLLQIGNEQWPGEYYSGYPVGVIMGSALPLVVSYGRTPAERRRSRVELWNKQKQISLGYNNPYAVGRLLTVCSTSPEASRRWLSDLTLKGFAARMGEYPNMHAEHIRDLVQGFPDMPGQWGVQSLLMMGGGAAEPGQSVPIEHGLAIRLRIPFPKARKLDIWMNGQAVPASDQDGYITWVAKGFTYVQINVPPEKSKVNDLYVVSCRYDPGENRVVGQAGLGW
jgi:hypothetical protein